MKRITLFTIVLCCVGLSLNAQIDQQSDLQAEIQAAAQAERVPAVDVNVLIDAIAQNEKAFDFGSLSIEEQMALRRYYANQNRAVMADIIPTAGATETFPVAQGDFFFDPGGPGGSSTAGTPGNYPNCGCVTLTTLDGATEIEFLDFSVFATFDWLRVYDSADTSGPVLFDNSTGGANQGDITLADMIASNGSATFTGTSGFMTFEFNATAVVDYGGWEVEVTGVAGGGCSIVGDCNLIDATPDDATSPDIWDRPFASGTCCSGLGPVSYDVYGPFQVDTNGDYTFDSTQLGWDGYIFVYENCFDPLDQVNGFLAGDDDGPGGIGTSQIVDLTLSTGVDYYLITTGFEAGEFGDFENAITGPGAVSCGVITNDTCANATDINCGQTLSGDTSDNTDTNGDGAPDEWFAVTSSVAGEQITVSTCDQADFDTILTVYDSCGGAIVAQNDDGDGCTGFTSELSFIADGSSTYFIAVDGFGGVSGTFDLTVTCGSANDECEDALAIECGVPVFGTTENATVDALPDCGTSITAPGVWYVYEDTTGLVTDITVDTCGDGTDYDTKLSVFTGECGDLVCVGGNDDACGLQSSVSFQSDGNTTYYILVHGFASGTGNFELTMTCTPIPPPNDLIVNSIDVDEIGIPYTDSNVAMPFATLENGNPTGCNIDGANGVWYNFVAAGSGTATAQIVSPAGSSYVVFFKAPDEEATEEDLEYFFEVGNQCAPGTEANITTQAGQAYYVFVVNTGGVTDIVIDGELLNTVDNVIEGFEYYPNPANQTLNLNAQDNIERVAIYNLLGQQVLSREVGGTNTQLNVASLQTGAYLMKVTVNGQVGTYKVIKR